MNTLIESIRCGKAPSYMNAVWGQYRHQSSLQREILRVTLRDLCVFWLLVPYIRDSLFHENVVWLTDNLTPAQWDHFCATNKQAIRKHKGSLLRNLLFATKDEAEVAYQKIRSMYKHD